MRQSSSLPRASAGEEGDTFGNRVNYFPGYRGTLPSAFFFWPLVRNLRGIEFSIEQRKTDPGEHCFKT